MEKQFTTLLFLLFPLLGIGQTNVTTTPAIMIIVDLQVTVNPLLQY